MSRELSSHFVYAVLGKFTFVRQIGKEEDTVGPATVDGRPNPKLCHDSILIGPLLDDRIW